MLPFAVGTGVALAAAQVLRLLANRTAQPGPASPMATVALGWLLVPSWPRSPVPATVRWYRSALQ